MKLALVIKLCFLFTLVYCDAQELKTKLVYACDFNETSDLDDWVMEGPGIASISDGQLLIHSKYYEEVASYYRSTNYSFSGEGGDFYPKVEAAMKQDIGKKIKDYYVKGRFRGGHLVYWNRFKTPDNYLIECDFTSLSDHALHMLMFSAYGLDGEDVFASSLNKRFGVAAQYTRGDIANYRISFFAPGRGTSNMRKSPGRMLTVKGEDFTLKHPKRTHHLKIIKNKHVIEWYINNELSFRFQDDINDYLKGGQTGIRLMVPAKGLYDNYRIYEILDE